MVITILSHPAVPDRDLVPVSTYLPTYPSSHILRPSLSSALLRAHGICWDVELPPDPAARQAKLPNGFQSTATAGKDATTCFTHVLWKSPSRASKILHYDQMRTTEVPILAGTDHLRNKVCSEECAPGESAMFVVVTTIRRHVNRPPLVLEQETQRGGKQQNYQIHVSFQFTTFESSVQLPRESQAGC
ncbi:hypothetical protein BDZ89DRAFT_1044338 [Hymenopellis radicata]|nr:hypothetical protein BDZ89DRAFT_1044338 [Hymenopellis radicata]